MGTLYNQEVQIFFSKLWFELLKLKQIYLPEHPCQERVNDGLLFANFIETINRYVNNVQLFVFSSGETVAKKQEKI